ILTKASEMRGKLMCEFEDGSRYKPEVFGIDPDTDLVLLKINKENLRAVKLESDLNSFVGSWMATVGIKEVPVSIGIVSHVARNIKNNVPNDAIIGIIPEIQENPDNNGVRINRVFTDSPAERSGLLVNDVIIQIDDEPIENRIKLLEQLSKYQPGDGINLKIRRGDEEKEVALILGKRKVNPMMDRGAIQNRMGSTLSKRRSNFPLAIQHDSTLNANECGGPIINIDGKVVGINIARDGRVSSLALPNEVVIPVIKKLKSGKMKPALVNKKEIKRVEKELELLVKQIGDLPKQTTELELKFSAGSAVEDEIRRQVKEAEARVKALKDRLAEKKKENGKLGDSIADIQSKRNRIERRREPLKQRLQQLQTGVK
ncbi:MAG: PDZ domain-containing protein, partial [Planctomycetota bacterium]